VLLISLARFVFYVLRSGLFDGGIEDLFLDGRVNFQGVFYLTEGAGLLFTVALVQVVFLLEQFVDRRMLSSSTTQLRPGAPFSLPPSCIARTREDCRITRILFSPTVRHPLSRTDELHRQVSTTCKILQWCGQQPCHLTLKAGEAIVSKTSMTVAYFTQLNVLGMCPE
jgi:hypothetical protein